MPEVVEARDEVSVAGAAEGGEVVGAAEDADDEAGAGVRAGFEIDDRVAHGGKAGSGGVDPARRQRPTQRGRDDAIVADGRAAQVERHQIDGRLGLPGGYPTVHASKAARRAARRSPRGVNSWPT